MNRAELAGEMAKRTGLTKKAADKVVRAFSETVTSAVASGDEVLLADFGVFSARHRKKRVGVNPKSGEIMLVQEADIPAFKPKKRFKEAIK